MEDLEGRLANNQEEVDSVYLSLQQQQRETERHAHNERTEEYRHLQSQIERLSQENLDLKSEVGTYITLYRHRQRGPQVRGRYMYRDREDLK